MVNAPANFETEIATQIAAKNISDFEFYGMRQLQGKFLHNERSLAMIITIRTNCTIEADIAATSWKPNISAIRYLE